MTKSVREIGRGKFAAVSEERTAQGARVAVKQFNQQMLGNPFMRERVLAAAQAWRALSVPGIVGYTEVDVATGKITMELMPRSANSRILDGPSDPRTVWQTLRGTLRVLEHLHGQGLMHGNLKPNNIFFDHDLGIRLSDGLLISTQSPGTLPPPTTQKYLSPEQTNDAWGQLGPATDLYCLGFVALELLAGERFGRAFQGVGEKAEEDDIAWFQWHASSTPAPSAERFQKTCPPEVVRVLSKLLAKNPRERYHSASEVLADMPENFADVTKQANVAAAAPQPVASAENILPRPKTGVVFQIASGPRAGEMFGTDDESIFVGFGNDCALSFSSDQYPHANAKLGIQRSREGWTVERLQGESVFVNQRVLDDSQQLRSGDIVRLSPHGPDIQFTLQSGGKSVDELAALLLPAGTAPAKPNQAQAPVRPEARQSPQPASPVASADRRTPAPPAPVTKTPVAAAPTSPGPSAANAPVRPAPPVAPSTTAAARHPSAPQAPVGNVVPGTPTGVAASKPTRTADAGQGAGFSLLSPNSWTKNQKNLVIAVVGGILVIVAVILFPSQPSGGGGAEPTVPEKSAEGVPDDAAGSVKAGTPNDTN